MATNRRPSGFEPAWLERSLERHYVWGLLFMAVLIAGFPLYRLREPSLRADALHQQQVTYASLGAQLFASNCAECHGKNGTGGVGPTLNAREFLGSTTDDQMRLLISVGISGTLMPAWGVDYGGPLTDQQVREIVAYLRSLEPTAPSVPNWRQGTRSS